jgi:hypothetical protein
MGICCKKQSLITDSHSINLLEIIESANIEKIEEFITFTDMTLREPLCNNLNIMHLLALFCLNYKTNELKRIEKILLTNYDRISRVDSLCHKKLFVLIIIKSYNDRSLKYEILLKNNGCRATIKKLKNCKIKNHDFYNECKKLRKRVIDKEIISYYALNLIEKSSLDIATSIYTFLYTKNYFQCNKYGDLISIFHALKHKQVMFQNENGNNESQEVKKILTPSLIPKSFSESDEDKFLLCGICFINKKSIKYNDCKHIFSCGSCSENLKICPLCREDIKSKELVYIS